jgi:hypothetical protein
MMWLFLIVAALVIAWLASSAVRKQKQLDRGRFPGFTGRDPLNKKEVGHR